MVGLKMKKTINYKTKKMNNISPAFKYGRPLVYWIYFKAKDEDEFNLIDLREKFPSILNDDPGFHLKDGIMRTAYLTNRL